MILAYQIGGQMFNEVEAAIFTGTGATHSPIEFGNSKIKNKIKFSIRNAYRHLNPINKIEFTVVQILQDYFFNRKC